VPNKKLVASEFVRISENPAPTLEELAKLLEAHEALFLVNDVYYDSVLFCGTDNLYFSYCFNCYTSRATAETLLIVENIIRLSDSEFVVISPQGVESRIFLKD